MRMCENCSIRKQYAKCFDSHFDWRDCPYACEYAKERVKEQPEIIRCKECKWWDNLEGSPYGYCMAMRHAYMSENWEIWIRRRYKGDFYCADAERSEDRLVNEQRRHESIEGDREV